MRYTPIDSVDRMFEQLRRDMLALSGSLTESWPALESGLFDPSLDLTETEDGYVVTVDMPGFEQDDIELRYAEGQLWLTAEHEPDDEAVTRQRSLREQVAIPRTVDVEAIEARYHNGVLVVQLPIISDADDGGHRIDIE